MLIHLDTSVLIDAFTGARRSMPALRRATVDGHVTAFSTLVLYEWLRGPRTDEERESVDAFFATDVLAEFGPREAERAALLFGQVKRARQRQADLAIAACAIEARASLWTLNRGAFRDVPGLILDER
jgi:predicted nucleic acid-binding protein